MPLVNEKGCPAESSPIPKYIHAHGPAESNPSLLQQQISRLSRLYAVNGPMAEALAPLVFLEVLR
jgi:hypothetical protein